MRTSGIIFFIILTLFFVPGLLIAATINEIMYDLEGSDTGREWVEIFNNGESVDLSLWRLFENDTNHKLEYIQGQTTLGAGEYAVIADNSGKFLLDWPNYGGALFDSSFSLKNTSELLILKDENLAEIDSVTYTSEWGASGDGNSLQLLSGSFKPSAPTPGKANTLNLIVPTEKVIEEEEEQEETTPTGNDENGAEEFPTTPQIKARAGGDRTVIVGASTEFRGESSGLLNEPLENARYVWNFGDGGSDVRQALFHTYFHPGQYVVTLSVGSGKFSASDRIIVTAIEPAISITLADSEKIVLTNQAPVELDLSFWKLSSKKTIFTLPPQTVVLPKSTLTLASVITGISADATSAVSLLYPNGTEALTYTTSVVEKSAVVQTPHMQQAVPQTPPSQKETSLVVKATTVVPEVSVVKEDLEEANAQTAAVVGSVETKNDSNNLFAWLFALTILITTAVVSILLIRRRPKSLAEQFEIIEESNLT